MFARILEFEIKLGKKEEFVKVVKAEVLPILKKQIGFLEILPFVPDNLQSEKVIAISLWAKKVDIERYEKMVYPKVCEILRPFVATEIAMRHYALETRLCEHFVETFAA